MFVLTFDHLDDVVVVTACDQSSVHLHNSQCSIWTELQMACYWHIPILYTT